LRASADNALLCASFWTRLSRSVSSFASSAWTGWGEGIAVSFQKATGLRWRSQFATEPTRHFPRFHGIDKRDHALVDMIAGKAFECPDVKS
jgi:hypothetical protein